ADVMCLISREGSDVSGLECRQRLLLRHGALATIGIRDESAERSLADPVRNGHWRSVAAGDGQAWALRDPTPDLPALEPHQRLLPESGSDRLLEIVPSSSHDRRRPAFWSWEPLALRPEERLHEQDAADGIVLPRPWSIPAKLGDALPNRVQRSSAVLDAEGVPGDADGKLSVVLEESAAGDVVER